MLFKHYLIMNSFGSILSSGRCNWPVSTSPGPVCDLLLLFSRLKNLETAHQSIVDAHQGAGVVELTAIVGRREQSDELSLGEKLVAIFDDLVSSADQVDIVLFVES